MKLLFFDTETTGLPLNPKASFQDIDNWPRIVQIAWIVCDENRNITSKYNSLIKPNGFTIPSDAVAIHSITTDLAQSQGVIIEQILTAFLNEVKCVDGICAYNIDFDKNVILSEMVRLNLDTNLIEHKPQADIMILGTDYCKIPHSYHGYRYPKLMELFGKLFSKSFENAHDAYEDTLATFQCFWKLYDLGYVDKEEYSFLLSEEERASLAHSYTKRAIENVWGTSRGETESTETLYLKAARLGDTEAMYKLALINKGSIVSDRTDYDTAIKWLEEIIRLSKAKKVLYYEDSLRDLVQLYKKTGNQQKVSYYQKLIDEEIVRKHNKIKEDAEKSESGFFTLVLSVSEGNNGFLKDKEKAYVLMEKGIAKGYRSLYWMYSEYLRGKGDARYFEYLIENIKDDERSLAREYEQNKWLFSKRSADYLHKSHKNIWLTKKYRLVAEAYLNGFGVDKSVKTAMYYLDKALSCDRDDRETIKLYAKVLTGQYGEEFVNYRYAQALIDSLPLKYMDDKSFYALLGDAYFGETKRNFFKASRLYDNYPTISSYKSIIRKKYCMMRNVILIAVFMAICGTIAVIALT